MGRSELASDPRFRDLPARLDNIQELDRIVSEWTRDKDAYDIASALQSQSIPSAPVLKAAELLHNPQLKDRGILQDA